jgi:acetylornithine deacetylase
VGPGDIAQAYAPDEFFGLEQIVCCEKLIDAVIADACA